MADAQASQEQQQQDPQQQPEQAPMLALPAPEEAPTLQVKLGEKLALDHLGPIIIQEDGTTARITNWASLSEREREITQRRIAKRNAERVAELHAMGIIPDIPYQFRQEEKKEEL